MTQIPIPQNIVPSYYRPLNPNGARRAPWHDYHSRCIYMITINRVRNVPDFAVIKGTLTDRNWPPVAEPTALGRVIKQKLSEIKKRFPATKIYRSVVMPEHIHFVIFNTIQSDYHLGDIIRHFKSECTHAYYGLESGESLEGRPSIFEDGYHDRILMGDGQLKVMCNYVSNNPRRRLERMQHSQFHHREGVMLPNGEVWECYGNRHLLEDFEIAQVRIGRRFTPAEREAIYEGHRRTVLNGGVLVSPFISPYEKEVYRWALENGGRLILIWGNGYGRNFSPKGVLHQLCSEGRLLIVAPMEHSTSKVECTRERCLVLNEVAAMLATSRAPVAPGGR